MGYRYLQKDNKTVGEKIILHISVSADVSVTRLSISSEEIFIAWKGVRVMVFNTQSHAAASVLNRMHTSSDCDQFLNKLV